MYSLGNQFLIDNSKNIVDKKSTFTGQKYRISILSERLIRFEYSDTGVFCDELTERILNREFPLCNFTYKEDNNYLEISTSYFKIEYQKNKPFTATPAYPTANLRVTVLSNEKRWYYKSQEVKNYGGSLYSIDNPTQNYFNGLYSSDGFASIDESNSLIFNDDGILVPKKNNSIDIYVFAYGADFYNCLKDYYLLTGKPELVPRYALGTWWSKNNEYNMESIKKLLTRFKSEEIPLSVFLFDKTWFTRFTDDKKGKLDYGYTINRRLFNPDELKIIFNNYNLHYGLNIDPSKGISKYEELYPKVSKYLSNNSDIIPFDVMNPKWLDVYFKLITHSLENYGFTIFWNDYYPEIKDINSLFLLNHYQFKDITRLNSRRSMILSRNTNIAPHRYPVVYSGRSVVSFETLKKVVEINNNASNIGLSFVSHDIGGYHYGIEDSELYLRYLQFGVFSPILRFSSEHGKYYRREPWKNDFKTLEISKEFFALRYKLIPYIYSEAYKYRNDSVPLVDPLYHKIPDMYYDSVNKNEYFFGKEVLVSPIVDKKDYAMNRVIQRFYLPEGVWYDFFKGKKFNGGRDYVSFYNDEDYPVFVSSGAIIVENADKLENEIKNPTNLEIIIFPGKNNSYNLFEDDGVSDKYKNGYYLITNIEYTYTDNKYTMIMRPTEGKTSMAPDSRNYKFRFKNVRMPDEIVISNNDSIISAVTYNDENDYVVEINDISPSSQITIIASGKNMIVDNMMVINDEIDSIIADIPIETVFKEKINSIMFGDLPINKKRIQIKKLGIDKVYIKLFIKLLEYVEVNL